MIGKNPRIAVLTGAVCLLALVAAAALRLRPDPAAILSFQEVKQSHRKSEAVLLDRHGRVIHEVRVEDRTRRLDWIALAEVSPALVRAITEAEDRRFHRHGGVDWLSAGRALVSSLGGDGARGASTITMQLASLLDPDLQPAGRRRNRKQKWEQMQAARSIEMCWSKAEILEAYLNLVGFRGELTGIAAASEGLLRKHPHGIDEREAVILAALVRAPNAEAGRVARRAERLAEDLGWDPRAVGAATAEILSRPYFIAREAALAPHVADQLIRKTDSGPGGRIREAASTLDGQLQQFAREVLERRLAMLRNQKVHDGAVMVVDNASGDVLAYVGNTGEESSARYVDGIRAQRQAGSTLKPFLYCLAVDRRLLTTASLIDDSPLEVPVPGGIYRPRNYDRQFHGPVTARIALASSLNVPAVKVLNLAGVDSFVQKLEQLGFGGLRAPDYYGPSLALGSADVTLWELVNAYRCLANGGLHSPLRLRREERGLEPRRIFSVEAAYIVSDILSDRESRSRTFSLESPLATRFWTAVKTGTSKDMRDNWCIGYSGRYTVGVWTGNFSGEPMWNVSGISGAAPVWVELMNYLHGAAGSARPHPPARLVVRTIQMAGGGPRRAELFIAGTETAEVREVPAFGGSRIAYPADGTMVALDPDIPQEDQKLFFEADPPSAELRWVLNGQDLGPAGSLRLWSPQRGNYSLSLVDGSNRSVDSVTFFVR
ncbi:MAG: penicillin-binding protein 1C [Acidobacteria bacterium]|nr:penicillin-binding protein 1C [Acidobacteriota bacterium]